MDICYVKLDAYYNRKESKYADSLENFVKKIKKYYRHEKYSILENLNVDYENSVNRLYFDIENIDEDKPNLIYEIIEKICSFLNIDKTKYALTLNKKSRHGGLSYHLFFPYFGYIRQLSNIVNSFCCLNQELINYIDTSVYSKNRLFRSIGACDLINNTHTERNLESFHELIFGNLEDTIIQNTENCKEIKYDKFYSLYFKNKEYMKKKAKAPKSFDKKINDEYVDGKLSTALNIINQQLKYVQKCNGAHLNKDIDSISKLDAIIDLSEKLKKIM